jgi:hypothetical protein
MFVSLNVYNRYGIIKIFSLDTDGNMRVAQVLECI